MKIVNHNLDADTVFNELYNYGVSIHGEMVLKDGYNVEKSIKTGEEVQVKRLRMTLSDLIRSHSHLRSLNLENNEQLIKNAQEARNRAYNQAYEYALQHEFISVERLRKMTMQEIANLIGEE